MTYQERLAWTEGGWQNAPGDSGLTFAVQSYTEAQNCLAYAGNWVGGPPDAFAQKLLYLRFSDGTLASLPLPRDQAVGTALPDAMTFSGNQFTYQVQFPEEASDGETLYHLAGTYRYTVDLTARTVSLTLTDAL